MLWSVTNDYGCGTIPNNIIIISMLTIILYSFYWFYSAHPWVSNKIRVNFYEHQLRGWDNHPVVSAVDWRWCWCRCRRCTTGSRGRRSTSRSPLTRWRWRGRRCQTWSRTYSTTWGSSATAAPARGSSALPRSSSWSERTVSPLKVGVGTRGTVCGVAEALTSAVTWLFRTCTPCRKGDTDWEVMLCMFIFTMMLFLCWTVIISFLWFIFFFYLNFFLLDALNFNCKYNFKWYFSPLIMYVY